MRTGACKMYAKKSSQVLLSQSPKKRSTAKIGALRPGVLRQYVPRQMLRAAHQCTWRAQSISADVPDGCLSTGTKHL